MKSDRVSGAFDNLDGPVAEFGEGVAQVWAILDAVGKEMTQPGK